MQKDIEDARRRRMENEERERRREEEGQLERERKKGSVAGSEVDYGVDETRPGSSRSKSSNTAKPTPKKKLPPTSPTARPPPARKLPPSILTRASNVITNLRKLVSEMVVHFKTRPLFLLQFLAFIIGLVVVLGRRDVKERLNRVLGGAWGRVKSTAGMGVKVSYI